LVWLVSAISKGREQQPLKTPLPATVGRAAEAYQRCNYSTFVSIKQYKRPVEADSTTNWHRSITILSSPPKICT